MTLQEMNNSYDEYALTEDFQLEEGLKVFKKSKKLSKYADRIDKAIGKAETKRKVSPSEVTRLKALSKDISKLSDEFKVIEDDFAKGSVSKKVSKEKLKRVKRTNERLLNLMKKDATKETFKKIGIGAVALGLIYAFGAWNPAWNYTTSAAMSGPSGVSPMRAVTIAGASSN